MCATLHAPGTTPPSSRIVPAFFFFAFSSFPLLCALVCLPAQELHGASAPAKVGGRLEHAACLWLNVRKSACVCFELVDAGVRLRAVRFLAVDSGADIGCVGVV